MVRINQIFSSKDGTTKEDIEKLHDLMVFIKKRERTEVAEELIHFLKSDCYKPRLKQEITRYVNDYESPIQEVIQGY